MKCEVLLFAQLREGMGCDRLTLELPQGATVGDAIVMLAKQHAPIAAIKSAIAVAVDEKYQPATSLLRDGCTIALIPPVSGG